MGSYSMSISYTGIEVSSLISIMHVLRLVIAWLNLDFGFELCFYDRMTALYLIWLEIGFILYIVFLQVAIIFLCRKYVLLT